MDRNAVIGFVLMALIIIAYLTYNSPSQEDVARMKHKHTSFSTFLNGTVTVMSSTINF